MSIFTYDVLADDGVDFQSGSIDTVYYDREGQRLGIEFQASATVYVYENVPESVYNLFIQADSLNHFYRTYIKSKFGTSTPYVTATERESEPETEPPLADWERELLEAADSPNEIVLVPDDAYSKFGVKWTGTFNSADERMGPFEYLTDATSAESAIKSFWTTARNLHGNAVTAKIVSVTQYFE